MYAVGHVALGFWAVADFSAHADMLVKPGGLQDSRWQKLSLVRQGFVCANRPGCRPPVQQHGLRTSSSFRHNPDRITGLFRSALFCPIQNTIFAASVGWARSLCPRIAERPIQLRGQN